MRLSVIYLVTYFVGGGLLLLNVFGFCPFRCDGALVRHCILVFESTWGVPCARTMPGKLKAIVKYFSESRFYQIRPEVDGTSMYDVQIAFIFPMLQNTKVKGD